MRLHDAVAGAAPFLIQSMDDNKVHQLPGASEYAQAVSKAPVRYALDDAAAALVAHNAFSSKNMMDASLDLLRFPSTEFWIEWHDGGRAKVIKDLGEADPMQDGAKQGRAGAFVKAEPCGRKGEIAILWENECDGVDLAPFIIEFDLDAPMLATDRAGEPLTRNVTLENTSILQDLFGCVRFRMSNAWRDYYERYSRNRANFEAIITTALKTVAGDFPFLASFCLMLSARGALSYQQSALDKLNAKRTRLGKPSLLDHVTVSLALDERGQGEGAVIGAAARRTSRLHHVCGHLVRRGASLHWRRAHLRGDPRLGIIAAKTVEVRSAGFARRAV